MTRSKFDILYESILTEMGDIHNSILKIYNWDNNKKDFSDLYNERINFIFKIIIFKITNPKINSRIIIFHVRFIFRN